MKQKRVVITDYTFPTIDRERAAAKRAGASFEAFQCRSEDEVVQAVSGADVAIVQFAPMTEAALKTLAPGAAVIRYGIGFDNIDVDAARDLDIQIGYIPDYCVDEVADHTAAMILASHRKLMQLDRSVRDHQWMTVTVAGHLQSSRDSIVGFFGLGRIGRSVLARLRPFGFRFLVNDPAVSREEAMLLKTESVSQSELLRESDILSLHAPTRPQTIRFLNANSLATMKSHAIIVNTARGKLIDEQALANAITNGLIGGAALDVFEIEPLPEESPLREFPNVILTPHSAWYSESAIGRLQSLAADDIDRLLAGHPPRCPVPHP